MMTAMPIILKHVIPTEQSLPSALVNLPLKLFHFVTGGVKQCYKRKGQTFNTGSQRNSSCFL